jgi:PAS domain S-box-containing protein
MVLSGFAIAIVLCIAIIIVRLAAGYHSGDPPMLVLYIIPVIIASYVGGLGPGLFCTFLAGGLAAYFLLPPFDSLRIESLNNQLNLAMMILTGLVVTFVVNSLHSQRVNVEKSNERYRIVAENTYSWEFWLDSKGNSLYQSPSCARITGYDVSEYMSNPDHLIKIVHPGDLELFRAHRHTVTSEKGPGNLQFRIIRPDSEVRWIEHFCLPVFGEDGTYLGTRGSNNDITDRKLMEETMIRTEKMVTVGGLAAGMAHELNNPLGGILQSLQNIRRRVSPELPANIKDAQAVIDRPNGATHVRP